MNEAQRQRLDLLAARFDEWMAAVNLASRTREGYRHNVRQFLEWLEEETGVEAVAQVNSAHLRQYQTLLHNSGELSVGAQAGKLNSIKKFFYWLTKEQQIAYNPASSLDMPRFVRKLPQILTKAEARRLVEAINGASLADIRDRAILEVLYTTGIRSAELLALSLYDVDLQACLLNVRLGKGGKGRLIPLLEGTSKSLDRYLTVARPRLAGATDRLFVSLQSGMPLDRCNLRLIVVRAAERAKLGKKVSPHILRHCCATHLLQGKADIRHIQKLLGHSSLSTTQLYTRVEVTDLREVLKRCHPWEKQ